MTLVKPSAGGQQRSQHGLAHIVGSSWRSAASPGNWNSESVMMMVVVPRSFAATAKTWEVATAGHNFHRDAARYAVSCVNARRPDYQGGG